MGGGWGGGGWVGGGWVGGGGINDCSDSLDFLKSDLVNSLSY